MAVATQNHIHMSATLGDVTGNVTSSKWNVMMDNWEPQYEVFVSAERAFGGALQTYAALTGAGAVLLAKNHTYRVRIDAAFGETALQRRDRLLGMLGKTIYVHPSQHDEAAHGTGYLTMFFQAIGNWEAANPALEVQYANISLMDKTP